MLDPDLCAIWASFLHDLDVIQGGDLCVAACSCGWESERQPWNARVLGLWSEHVDGTGGRRGEVRAQGSSSSEAWIRNRVRPPRARVIEMLSIAPGLRANEIAKWLYTTRTALTEMVSDGSVRRSGYGPYATYRLNGARHV